MYNYILLLGDNMKLYIDLILLLNFIFDFILLLTVKIVLKRNIKLYKILLGSILGSLSILFLFIDINNIELLLLKIVISILMILITFGKKDFSVNLFVLYIVSIILGGFLYLINIELSYKHEGIIFYNNSNINIIVILILTPIIMYIYYKQNKLFKNEINNYYKIDIIYKGKVRHYNAYLDTGNILYDQYKKRPISLLYDTNFKYKENQIIYVPYKTLNNNSLLKCIKVDKLIIDNKYIIENALIGISNEPFKINDTDIILNRNLL